MYKKCAIKQEIKFESFITSLEAARLKNKIKLLRKNNIEIDSLMENHK